MAPLVSLVLNKDVVFTRDNPSRVYKAQIIGLSKVILLRTYVFQYITEQIPGIYMYVYIYV